MLLFLCMCLGVGAKIISFDCFSVLRAYVLTAKAKTEKMLAHLDELLGIPKASRSTKSIYEYVFVSSLKPTTSYWMRSCSTCSLFVSSSSLLDVMAALILSSVSLTVSICNAHVAEKVVDVNASGLCIHSAQELVHVVQSFMSAGLRLRGLD